MAELKTAHKAVAAVVILAVLGTAVYLIVSGGLSADSSGQNNSTTSTQPPSSAVAGGEEAQILPSTPSEAGGSSGSPQQEQQSSSIYETPTPPNPDISRSGQPSGELTSASLTTEAPPLDPSTPKSTSSLSFSEPSSPASVEILHESSAPSIVSTRSPPWSSEVGQTDTIASQPPIDSAPVGNAITQTQDQKPQPPELQQLIIPNQSAPEQPPTDVDDEPLPLMPDRTDAELNAWRQFRTVYKKQYPSKEEIQRRQTIFIGNSRYIEQFNAAKVALFQLGINQFADLTRDEINGIFFAPQTNWTMAFGTEEPPALKFLEDDTQKPIDWRNISLMPADQGVCRESSVYAVVASIEAKLNQPLISQNLPPVKLSEFQVLDCLRMYNPPQAPPCAGVTSMTQVLEHLQKGQVGLLSAGDYINIQRVRSAPGQNVPLCQPPPDAPIRTKVTGYSQVHQQNIPDAINNSGPLAVAIDASQPTFHFYRSGLYHDINCSQTSYNLHALLVGYEPGNGREQNNQLTGSYTLRLSFGPNWGEAGHIRLLKDEQRNKCLPQRVGIFPELLAQV